MEIIETSAKEETKKGKKKQNNNRNGLLLFIIILFAFGLGMCIMYEYKEKTSKTVTKNRVISQNTVTEEAMEDAIDKIYDAVLCIEVLNNSGEAASTGTGFVYEKDDKYGYVLTNAHVVSGGTNVQGMLSNNEKVKLTILGTDTYTDIAVLRMDAKDVLKVASIGTSKNTKIGNTVFTVGSPLGSSYAGTVTKGILSGKDRLIETSASTNGLSSESYTVKVLQTDAAISPGNSGGPLVNLAGDVIGITSLKLVDEKVEGMGFAIPIEDVLTYVDTLEKKEKIKRPVLGVQILDMTNKYLLYRYNIQIDSKVTNGIILMGIEDGYPAASAGLKKGDIITKVNGEDVTTSSGFKYELYKYSVGDEIELTYYRDGKENKVKVKLDKTSE